MASGYVQFRTASLTAAGGRLADMLVPHHPRSEVNQQGHVKTTLGLDGPLFVAILWGAGLGVKSLDCMPGFLLAIAATSLDARERAFYQAVEP